MTLSGIGVVAPVRTVDDYRVVVPIYALALLLAHESELAVYLDGQFVPQMDAFFVDRMLQSASAVEVRRFKLAGVARSTLERLSSPTQSLQSASGRLQHI